MSSDNVSVFTKENLDSYLKELAKEYRKINGKKMRAEIILIGGAAILTNYGFREMTTDIDAVMRAASSMKDAINQVGDKFGLPNGWLNSDFKKTRSYSPKLFGVSIYYKTFSNVLEVRTVTAEYLIAMKLCAGRKYKNDLSDIIGILAEHEKNSSPITMDMIDNAVKILYDGWDNIPKDSKKFIEDAMQKGDYENIYSSIRNDEKVSKEILIEFEQDYPQVVKESNLDEILSTLKEKIR